MTIQSQYTSALIALDESPTQLSVRKSGWFWAALVGSLIMLSQTLVFGFGYDHGIMQYTAWAGLNGRWPYVDTWETAFPGGILLHMFVLMLGGTSPFSFRI